VQAHQICFWNLLNSFEVAMPSSLAMFALALFPVAVLLQGCGDDGGASPAPAPPPLPTTMTAMLASGTPCSDPDWTCLSLSKTVPVPTPGKGMALVKMYGASVNPLNVDLVEPVCKYLPASGPYHCSNGTFGNDGAGVVAAVGEQCTGVNVGDEVFGFFLGSYAQYSLTLCAIIAPKPQKLNFTEAGSLPVAALTSMQAWTLTGAPWGAPRLWNHTSSPLTVVVTGGQGGTGVFAIQLAKAFAPHATVITAASGGGIDVVKKLGADVVIDYHKQELFEALPDNSVDIVFDNIGLPGTADKAMHAIREGGTYAVLTGGGGGKISDNPKPDVKQIDYAGVKPNTADLEQLAKFFDSGAVLPVMAATYALADVPAAFSRSLGHGIFGKIAVKIEDGPAPAIAAVVV